jgi:excisionase family DNA binding protein
MTDQLTYMIPEAAHVLGIGGTHLYRLIRSGELPSITLGSGG